MLTVLEAGKSKIKVLADLVPGEGLLPGLMMAVSLLLSSRGGGKGRERQLSLVISSSYKNTNPIVGSPSCDLI
jgi:hypothetical protein